MNTIQLRANKRSRGFTLLELIMVLVILGAIMALVGPRVFGGLGKAKSGQAKIQMEQIGGALDMFKLEVGRYPSQSEGLNALVTAPSGAGNWNGPYLKDSKMIKDPWGNDFKYTVSGSKYEISSMGADGKDGGTGEDADIKSGG